MKKIILLAFVMCFTQVYAQTYRMYQTKNFHNQLRLNTKTGEVIQMQDDGGKWTIVSCLECYGENNNRFELYETKNMWTFIELDTYTGRLWQVQFSTRSENEMLYVPINRVPLANSKKSVFTISPMVSMFQYYLINEESGEMWKFQWSTKGDDYRWIEPY